MNESRLAALPLEVSVSHGVDAVMAHAAAIARLGESLSDVPVTALWPWIAASVARPAAGIEPWVLSLHAGHELVGAVILLDDVSGSVRRTTLAGTEEDHRGCFLALNSAVGAHLGGAFADALMTGLREFSIGPVANGPAVAAMLNCLPIGVVVDEVEIPIVHAEPGLPIGMSHGTARTLRKSHNRLVRDGLQYEITFSDDRHEITTLMPLLENISRDRDIAAGRVSSLDDADGRRLWQRRLLALVGTGALQLATLWLDGEIAAYVLGIKDGSSYRILGGRYVSRWGRYAPGRILEAAVLDSVVACDDYLILDWMSDVASETLLARNGSEPLVVIRGRTQPV